MAPGPPVQVTASCGAVWELEHRDLTETTHSIGRAETQRTVAQTEQGEHQGSVAKSPGLGLSQQQFLLL